MDRATAVVNDQSFFLVGSDPDVTLRKMRFASDAIDIFHEEWGESAFVIFCVGQPAEVCNFSVLACQPKPWRRLAERVGI